MRLIILHAVPKKGGSLHQNVTIYITVLFKELQNTDLLIFNQPRIMVDILQKYNISIQFMESTSINTTRKKHPYFLSELKLHVRLSMS